MHNINLVKIADDFLQNPRKVLKVGKDLNGKKILIIENRTIWNWIPRIFSKNYKLETVCQFIRLNKKEIITTYQKELDIRIIHKFYELLDIKIIKHNKNNWFGTHIDNLEPNATKEHLIHFYMNQRVRLEDLHQRLKDALPKERLGIEHAISRIEEADPRRARIALKIILGKEPTLSELSLYTGKSINSLRSISLGKVYADLILERTDRIIKLITSIDTMNFSKNQSLIDKLKEIQSPVSLSKIAEHLEKRPQDAMDLICSLWIEAQQISGTHQKNFVDLQREIDNAAAAKLGIQVEDADTWLRNIDSETSISNDLSQLSHFADQVKDQDKINESIIDLTQLLIRDIEKAKSSDIFFSLNKPFNLIKLNKILNVLDLFKSDVRKSEIEKLKHDILGLIDDISKNMPLKRQAAIMEILKHQKNMGQVNNAVQKAFFRNIKDIDTLDKNLGTATAKVNYIMNNIQTRIEALERMIGKSVVVSEVMEQIPSSLKNFFKNHLEKQYKIEGSEWAETEVTLEKADLTLERLLNKMKKVKERQKNRIASIENGEIPIIPQYFHATKNKTATSIVKTGIEPQEASRGFGAYFSSNPETAFGWVIFGLPKSIEFNGPEPIFLDSLNEPQIERTDIIWAAHKKFIPINPREMRLRENFRIAIQQAVKKSLVCALDTLKAEDPEKVIEMEERIKAKFNRMVTFRPFHNEKGEQVGWSLHYKLRYSLGNINTSNDLENWVNDILGDIVNKVGFKWEFLEPIFKDFVNHFNQYYFSTHKKLDANENDYCISSNKAIDKIKACIIAPDDEHDIFKYLTDEDSPSEQIKSISMVKKQFEEVGVSEALAEFIPLSEQLIELDILREVDSSFPKNWWPKNRK